MGIRFLDEETPSSSPAPSKTIRFLEDSQTTQAPTSGFVMGLKDPISGAAQLLEKALPESVSSKINQLNNKLAEYGLVSPVDAGGVSGMVQKEEQQYQQQRQAAGSDGFDFGRLAGNIANPANFAVPGGGGLVRAATTGAALSATQPVYSNDFWESKGIQAATGAVLGPAIQYGVQGAGALLDKMKGLTANGQKQALQDWLKELTGNDAKIMQVLSKPKELVKGSKPTAAEAVADLPQGVQLAAAQKALSKVPTQGAAYEQRAQAQQAARQAELAPIAGTAEERAALAAERQTTTTPMREDALAQANIYGQVAPKLGEEVAQKEAATIANLQGAGKAATEEAQATVRANTWSPVPGYPRFPGRYSPNYERAKEYVGAVQDFADAAKQRRSELDFKKLQLQSVTDEGFYPLSTAPLITKIDSSLSKVGERSNELLTSSLQSMKGKLEKFTDQNGIINSIDLYNIRKEIADDIKANLVSKQGTNASFTTQAANVEQTLKKYLDDAINKASGSTLWSDYLSKYSTYSQKLNRMEIGAELEKKLGTPLANKERAASFAQAVEESAGLIKKATGLPRYDKLSQVLTPEETGAVNRVLADLQRQSAANTLAGKITAPVYKGAVPLEGLGLFNQAYTLAKEALGYLARGKRAEFENKFTELSLNPQAMALFIQSGPITNQRKFVAAINKSLSPQAQQILLQSVATVPLAREAGQ